MNMFSNVKKGRKLILILVLLVLFNFCFPKQVKAFDFVGNISSFIFYLERGIIKIANNIFCDDNNAFEYKIMNPSNAISDVYIKVKLTPENIIKGKFILFNADIFKDITKKLGDYYDGGRTGITNGRTSLRNVIAGWYYALRNFAIVALLSVLVYVGIRMVMSTIAQDKAKYKIMFKDWLVALCLVVVMHYMMISILNISGKIVEAIGTTGNAESQTEKVMTIIATINTSDEEDAQGNEHYVNMNGKEYNIGDAFGYELVLGVIIFYTVLFAIKYLKREFTILFLILLGPISCITYPIDKISDGKAQAFNKWFSEFLYQVIIQPFHLLIYIVLVGSATELANENLLYSIICFAVMIPAEKFIKEMFGFKDKLGSPLGAMATGAAASQIFNKMRSGGSSGKSGGGSVEKGNGSAELPVKTKDAPLPGKKGDSTYISQEDKARLPASEGGNPVGGDQQALGTGEGVNEAAGEAISDASTAAAIADGVEDNSNTNTLSAAEQMDEAQGQNEFARRTTDALDKGEEKKGWRAGVAAVQDKYSRNLLQKYGTVDKKELAKKRAWRATKGLGKLGGRTIKRAVTLTGALAGATALGIAGAMVGQGGKGAAAGAALGASLGNSIGKKGDKFVSKTGDYAGTFYNAANDKDTKKDKYKSNINNIDRARRNFRDNNDGVIGTGEDIDKELDNMYKMTTYGVEDGNIEKAMSQYHENLKGGMNEEDAMNFATMSALESQSYSAKDFRDEKAMAGLYKDLYEKYIDAGCTDAQADSNTRKIIQDAGKLKGVNKVALPPPTNQTIDIPVNRSVPRALGIELSDDYNEEQGERVNQLNIRLKDMGYSDSEINQIASSSANSRASVSHVIDTYETKVEYLENEEAQNQAKLQIESMNGGRNATAQEVRTEMQERLVLKSTFNVGKEKDVSALRSLETTELKEKTQIQAAREFAKENKGQLNNEGRMATKKQQLVDRLKSGGSSTEKALKDAENIINLAGQYNNEIK